MDKWHSGPFISPGCCNLLDDAWRDASSLLELHPVLELGLNRAMHSLGCAGAVRIEPELPYCAGGNLVPSFIFNGHFGSRGVL